MDILSLTPLIIEYRYWILVPLAFIEGPLVSLTAGLLSAMGYFNPWLVLLILVGKDIIVDAICYAVGRYGNYGGLVHRYAKKIGITDEHWGAVERLWYEHPWRTMFISKVAYGLSYPFLISAGLSRVSYKRFWFYAVQISFIQYGVLMAVGYFFGNSISIVKNSLEIVGIIIAVLSLVQIGHYFFSRRMRTTLLKEEKEAEREISQDKREKEI